ncbi:DUF1648 domain-containing protein [Saccharomonospora viridis]|uniref:DUF1648 domain-containing protein n=1 Tax=Saccharomonospora viridis TaxID=1852 RepID=UPI00240A12E6|nr:DUF1648 domain-containing protein [Saccharomonospora viridis]
MRKNKLRILLATLGVPAVVFTVALLLRDAWAARLPTEVASHWGAGGVDDGIALDTLATWTLSAGAVLAVASTVLLLVLLRRGYGTHRPYVLVSTLLTMLPMAALISSMAVTLDAASWREAGGAGAALAVLAAVLVPATTVAVLIAPSVPPTTGVPDTPGDATVGLAAGQRATWNGAATNVALASGCVLAPLLALFLVDLLTENSLSWSGYAVPIAVGVLAMLGVSRVRVIVDSTGVTIRMGVLGFPTKHIPLSDIVSAAATTTTLFRGGGLGIRTTPTGDTLFKVRGGPTLELVLTSGRRVLANVDHPDQAAGLVNDLLREALRQHD